MYLLTQIAIVLWVSSFLLMIRNLTLNLNLPMCAKVKNSKIPQNRVLHNQGDSLINLTVF